MIKTRDMKVIVFTLLISAFLGCSKDNDKEYCWECEVQRTDGSKFQDKKCYDYPTAGAPEYKDANGNPLQVGPCTKNW